MKLGSLFDGSGGFPLAGFLCDIEPVWASEIEPYPIAVTKSRFPHVKHLGDISKINGAEIEPVDIITFGSPCQDLSVAGKRAGLKHEDNGDDETTRSGLFMEAVRIIKEMRRATNGKYPRWICWENVPGAFSSNKGEDFKIVLEEIIKIVEPTAVMPEVPRFGWAYADSYVGNGWSLAYRVFDAQYWGVPQRRRRIYLVADFGSECAREILFEREGLRGYFAESRTPWQTTPADAERSIGADDRKREIPYTLKIRSGCEGGGKGALIQEDKSATLACNNDQYLFQPTAYGICAYESNSMKSSNPHSGIYKADTSRTLDLNGGNPACNQGGIAIVEEMVLDDQGGSQISVRHDGKAPTLRAEMHGNVPCVMKPIGADIYNLAVTGDTVGSLTEGGYGSTGSSPKVLEPIAVATQQGGAEITENGTCPTITAAAGMSGNNQPWICQGAQVFENHSQDTRYKGPIDVAQTVSAKYGTGGNNQPFVVEQQPFCKSHRAQTADDATTWKHGKIANTLNTFDQGETRVNELVVETVALEGNGQRPSHRGDGYLVTDKSYTLNTTEVHGVAYQDIIGSLYARDANVGNQYVGQNKLIVEPYEVHNRYIVRRLIPTECARLQGFDDRWGDIDKKTKFSDEEYHFWHDVRNTHAAINGRAVKEYNKKQMLTWYNKLHTDSAEYKMWGNGIALPTALYVMQGIKEVSNENYQN